MVQTIFIGIAAGIAAALLFLAPASGSVLAFPLFALTGLPLAIAALGWGAIAGAAAAAAGAVVIFALVPGSLVPPAIFLVLFGVPVVWLARLVGLTRPDGDGDAGLQWYPLGRLLLQVTVAAGIAVVAVAIVSGYDPEAMVREATSALVDLLTEMQTASLPPTPAEVEPMVRIYVGIMPFMVALLMTAILVVDLWLGSLVARASSRFRRPTEPLWTVALPNEILIGFPIAVALGFLPGVVGAIAKVFAGAFACGLLLVGLAVLHALTRGSSARLPILVLVYILLIFSGLPIILFVIVGAAETFLHLRARRIAPRSTP